MRRHLMMQGLGDGLPAYEVYPAYFNPNNWGADSHGAMADGVGYILKAQQTHVASKALWQVSGNSRIVDSYFLVEGLQPGDILGLGTGYFTQLKYKWPKNGIIYVDEISVPFGFAVWNQDNPGERNVTLKRIKLL